MSAWTKEMTAAAAPDAASFQQARTDTANKELAYIEVDIFSCCCAVMCLLLCLLLMCLAIVVLCVLLGCKCAYA